MNNTYPSRLYYTYTDALNDEALFKRLYDDMPKCRQEKVDSVKQQADKERSLSAGVLLVKGLSEYGINKDDIDALIYYGDNGKPYLRGEDYIFFNLSHSGNMAIAAFSYTETGCDVERVKGGTPYEINTDTDAEHAAYIKKTAENNYGIAKRFFSADEREYLEQFLYAEDNKFNDEFARIWSLKESYIKQSGEGLSIPLNSFSVFDLHNINFSEFSIDTAYKISCCYEGSAREFLIEKHAFLW